MTTLQETSIVPGAILPNFFTITTTGGHTLSFGVATEGVFLFGNAVTADPHLTVQNVVLTNPVPEPSTLALLGVGLAFLLRRRLR